MNDEGTRSHGREESAGTQRQCFWVLLAKHKVPRCRATPTILRCKAALKVFYYHFTLALSSLLPDFVLDFIPDEILGNCSHAYSAHALAPLLIFYSVVCFYFSLGFASSPQPTVLFISVSHMVCFFRKFLCALSGLCVYFFISVLFRFGRDWLYADSIRKRLISASASCVALPPISIQSSCVHAVGFPWQVLFYFFLHVSA
jgi:hypothetical protein